MEQNVLHVVSTPQVAPIGMNQHPTSPAPKRPRRGRSAGQESTKLLAPSPYLAPKELAARWRVTRSTADRIAREHGITRLCLGDGKNGSVRFRLDDVLRFEQQREVV